MTDEAIIRFESLSFGYGPDQVLFRDVSLNIRSGGFHLIQGPSGSGKSTLLRLINRLEEPTGGRILFRDRPLTEFPPPVLRRTILYIQQTPTLIDASIRDNLMLPFTFRHNADLNRPDEARLIGLLNEFLLGDISLNASALALSVGQQQRLCFIRGLLLAPELLLLDEPTSALDDESARVVESAAEGLNVDKGLAVVMVSHRAFNPRTTRPTVFRVANRQVTEAP